jgi:hypothetical protein
MKMAVAIVCSLLLAGTQIVPAAAPLAGAANPICSARPCCKKDCSKCCAARPAPASQPVSAPVRSSLQEPSASVAPALVAWTLPAPVSLALPDFHSLLASSIPAPLYARDCARLI